MVAVSRGWSTRLLGTARDQRLDRRVVAGRLDAVVVIRGKHRDAENAQRPAPCLDRRLHGLRIGVNRQESCAQARGTFHALCNRIADIVQLEIEKDLLAGAGELLRVGESASISELIADLVERHRVAEPRHQRFRGLDRRKLECHDQALTRRNRHSGRSLRSFRHHARQVDKPSNHFLQGGREIFVLESVHIVESVVCAADIDLFGQNQRTAADFQNLPQRQQREHCLSHGSVPSSLFPGRRGPCRAAF